MTTDELFREDATLLHCEATVLAVDEGGIVLDRTVFYPLGGGQAGDAGELLTPDGRRVSITDTHGNVRNTLTGSFGYFRFDEIVAGESYVVAVTSKRYVFSPRIVNPTDELTDVDFVPQ